MLEKMCSCGVKIGFIKVNGKSHPVTLPAKKTFVLEKVDFRDITEYKLREGYESHFATCTDKEKFRRVAK